MWVEEGSTAGRQMVKQAPLSLPSLVADSDPWCSFTSELCHDTTNDTTRHDTQHDTSVNTMCLLIF